MIDLRLLKSGINIPKWIMNIKYNSSIIPKDNMNNIENTGANCQVYIYEILRYNGLFIPNYRSNELWNDTTYSFEVDKYKPLDIIFFNNSNSPWGAHLGLYLGDDYVLHISKRIGKPIIWNINHFKNYDEYKIIIGAKRIINNLSKLKIKKFNVFP